MANSNLTKYKDDLATLVQLGGQMSLDLTMRAVSAKGKLTEKHKPLKQKVEGTFERDYQRWYTESSAVVRQLIPDRLAEFDGYYRTDPKRKTVDLATYTIQDWLTGFRAAEDYRGDKRFDDLSVTLTRFQQQLEILKSAAARFDSSLLDIRQVLQADIFESQLDAAGELQRKGFLRAAGVVAGVVLEGHLAGVCDNHRIPPRKKHPTINDLNDLLKENSVIDVPTWRFIQRVSDLRNLCAHHREREPTSDEVSELLTGTDKISKTVY